MPNITLDGEYQTRDGRPVRVLCVDRNGLYPVVAMIGDSQDVRTFSEDGVFGLTSGGRDDLILRRREPVRESRWRFVPTMHGSPCYSYLYPTLVDARKALGCNHNGVYTHIERLDFENNKLVAVTLEPQ